MEEDAVETVLTLRDLIRFPRPVSTAASQGASCPSGKDEGWGGRLLRNKPAAFTKNSSLGVGEELLPGYNPARTPARATHTWGPLATDPRGGALRLHLLFFSKLRTLPSPQSKSRLLSLWGRRV